MQKGSPGMERPIQECKNAAREWKGQFKNANNEAGEGQGQCENELMHKGNDNGHWG